MVVDCSTISRLLLMLVQQALQLFSQLDEDQQSQPLHLLLILHALHVRYTLFRVLQLKKYLQ